MVTHRLGAGLLVIYVVAAACASAPKLPVFGTWRVATFSGPAVPQTSVMALHDFSRLKTLVINHG